VKALILLAANATSIAAVIIAGQLAMAGKPDWGWFLTVAVITTVVYSKADSKPE